MAREYVEKRETGYYIAGSRLSLDAIVFAFHNGDTPETIRASFPTLSLEEVYGGITFYLAHREEVDATLAFEDPALEQVLKASRDRNPELFRKLAAAQRLLHK